MVSNYLNRFLFLSPLIGICYSFTLLVIAYSFEYFGGLIPCQMCEWQRWPHLAVILFCILSFLTKNYSYYFLFLAGLSALVTAIIGGWHTGLEMGFLEGPKNCSNIDIKTSSNVLNLMESPIINCNIIVWSFLELSMAAWNSILSFIISIYCLFFGYLKRKAINE